MCSRPTVAARPAEPSCADSIQLSIVTALDCELNRPTVSPELSPEPTHLLLNQHREIGNLLPNNQRQRRTCDTTIRFAEAAAHFEEMVAEADAQPEWLYTITSISSITRSSDIIPQ